MPGGERCPGPGPRPRRSSTWTGRSRKSRRTCLKPVRATRRSRRGDSPPNRPHEIRTVVRGHGILPEILLRQSARRPVRPTPRRGPGRRRRRRARSSPADVDEEERIARGREFARTASVIRRASSSPEITSTSIPQRDRTAATKSAAFSASRTAHVATARIVSAPAARRDLGEPLDGRRARLIASGDRRPVAKVSWPRRTRSFSRERGSRVPSRAHGGHEELDRAAPDVDRPPDHVMRPSSSRSGATRGEGIVNTA